MTIQWYETKTFTLINSDVPTVVHDPTAGEDDAFRTKIYAQGWEADKVCPDNGGYINVQRLVDFERPEGELFGFTSLRHIAETVSELRDDAPKNAEELAAYQERVEDALKNLQQRADTAIKREDSKAIEALQTRVQHQADTLDAILDRLNAAHEPCQAMSAKTGPLADEIDYEACGAPWTLTIEGGRRR